MDLQDSILTRFLAVHTVMSESAGIHLLALNLPLLSQSPICCADQELRSGTPPPIQQKRYALNNDSPNIRSYQSMSCLGQRGKCFLEVAFGVVQAYPNPRFGDRKSGYNKGTLTDAFRCLVVSTNVRRHRLISVSYISLLPCHRLPTHNRSSIHCSSQSTPLARQFSLTGQPQLALTLRQSRLSRAIIRCVRVEVIHNLITYFVFVRRAPQSVFFCGPQSSQEASSGLARRTSPLLRSNG